MAAVAGHEDTRTRLLATALKLFTEHGVEGTSLQMIADELGVTKAAVYYHFKTKDEITEAVVEPGLRELESIVAAAARQRRPGARIDHLLAGFVDVVVRHRALVALFSGDPGVARALEKHFFRKESFMTGMMTILTGPDPDAARVVAVHAALGGIALAGGAQELARFSDDVLRESLLDVGRKLLGRPRRRPAVPS
ncbi:TetR/AcrR family transcriptional regulator [Amycolatopsis viridis]|uniref:AcrR family transcriptional regulator n=1 Tax=Amycolatopsis viridis TaxID=185678 RepID=A0ABX0SQR0_9PSEU|nr:TetR family transcriptional regulator [Amycolatopsis viridis]NIH79309.1 AcrR family transcriptional regulator [Amycolatopsis viridis]